MIKLCSLFVIAFFTLHANANWFTDTIARKGQEYFNYAYGKLAPEKKDKFEKLRGQAVQELKKKNSSTDPATVSISRVFLCISGETSILGIKFGICSEVSTHYLPSFAAVYGSGDDFEAADTDVFALMYDGPPTTLHDTTFTPAKQEEGDGILETLIQTYHDTANDKRTIAIAGMALIPGESSTSDLTLYETDSTETIQKRIVDGKYLDEF